MRSPGSATGCSGRQSKTRSRVGVPAPCAGIHHGTPSGNRAHLHKPDSQRSQAIGQSGGVAGGESDHYPQAE